jgi:hypothetical protein
MYPIGALLSTVAARDGALTPQRMYWTERKREWVRGRKAWRRWGGSNQIPLAIISSIADLFALLFIA